MSDGERIWQAALGLVGTAFRFHGSDPATGLDCVGLAAAAYRAAGHDLPALPIYRTRDMVAEAAARLLTGMGFEAAADRAVGDVLLLMMAPRQPHLMIAGPGACVHAHAGLRRVVLMPGAGPSVLVGRWRRSGSGG